MKKIISDVVNFPNGCETVRFTACFSSMIMRADDSLKAMSHEQVYNLYSVVSGYAFLQMDLSDESQMCDGWPLATQKILRNFDYYVGFVMDYAGYDFEEVQAPESKESIFAKIKLSIDSDKPVLVQFTKQYQWVLVIGYDENGTLYGYDGSQGYWGASAAEPSGYENDCFIMPDWDWYDKMAHAFIIGEKKQSSLMIRDAFARGIRIMESMHQKSYFKNSVTLMQNSEHFDSLNDDALLVMRNRISDWIGLPIDMRSVLSWHIESMLSQDEYKNNAALVKAHTLCCAIHDTLWIAWRAVGEFMDGDPIDWARGLQNAAVRRTIADVFELVCSYDEKLLECLKAAFE